VQAETPAFSGNQAKPALARVDVKHMFSDRLSPQPKIASETIQKMCVKPCRLELLCENRALMVFRHTKKPKREISRIWVQNPG
jgi:hypothetical protein